MNHLPQKPFPFKTALFVLAFFGTVIYLMGCATRGQMIQVHAEECVTHPGMDKKPCTWRGQLIPVYVYSDGTLRRR